MTEMPPAHPTENKKVAGRARRVRYYPILILLVVIGLLFGGIWAARWNSWVNRALMRVYNALDVRDSGPLGFTGHFIAGAVPGDKYVYAVDVDGDGDLDVVSFGTLDIPDASHPDASHPDALHRQRSQVAWHENAAGDGSTWKTYVVDRPLARAVDCRDLDGDGDVDIQIEPAQAGQARWYENDGASHPTFLARDGAPSTQGTSPDPSEPCGRANALDLLALLDDPLIRYGGALDTSPALLVSDLVSRAQEGRGVIGVDLDGDLDDDLLVVLPDRGLLSWYENDGRPSAGLTAHIISSRAYGAGNVCVADLDGDGDPDVLAGFMGDRIAWWEQKRARIVPPRLTLERSVVTVTQGQKATNGGRYGGSNGGPLSLVASVGQVADEGEGRWSWTYSPPGEAPESQTVTVTARDERDAVAYVEFQLVVERAPPRVTLQTVSLIEPGDAALGGGSVSGLVDDAWQARVDYGDGSGERGLPLAADGTFVLTHLYRAPGDYSLTVCIQDDLGREDCASEAVNVVQTLPQVRLVNRSGRIREGETALLAFGATSGAGLDRALSNPRYSYDCDGDGVFEVEDLPERWLYRCFYPDDGAYTARGRVKGESGAQVEVQVEVQVDNVAPTALLEARPAAARAGEPVYLAFSQAKDAGPADVEAGFLYAYDCTGDGGFELEGASENTYACADLDSGVYVARARISDRDGGWNEYTVEVRVEGAAPEVRFTSLTQPVYEGQPAQLAFVLPDGSSAGQTYSFDCAGDGVYEQSETSSRSFACLYPNQGTYSARGRITDAEGNVTEYEFEVVVQNVAPTARLVSVPDSVLEGEAAYLVLEDLADPSAQDAARGYRCSFDCTGDGVYEAADTTTASYLCTYDQNGLYVARARVSDLDGAWNEYTVRVRVANVPPTANLPGSATVDEGQTYALTLSEPYDPSPVDTAAGFRYAYDCEGDGAFEITDYSFPQYACTYPDDGSILSRAQIMDVNGGSSSYTIRVTALNVSPTVGAISIPLGPFRIGTEIEAEAEFSDAGLLDVHSARWEWSDGRVSSGSVQEVSGSGVVSGTHAYTEPGLYTVLLEVSDGDGGVGSSTRTKVPVYDPAARAVHGEVRFDSPPGAYTFNLAFSRQARLSLSCQYEVDAVDEMAPVGWLTFELIDGGMRFEGEQFDWLVVSGKRVWLMGWGTINGVGRYGVAVALDFRSDPGLARVRLWDEDNDDASIYDSQPGEAHTAALSTPLTQNDMVLPNR